MSKIINIPGTTSFIPLNDVIDIKIHGALTEEERISFPDSPEDTFTIGVSSEVSLYIVTRYVTEAMPTASDENTDEDEDSDESNDEDSDAPEEETKIARILYKTHPLNVGAVVDLTESQQYLSKDEKIQEQTDLRIKLYNKNLSHILARDEILTMSSNISAPMEVASLEEGDVREIEEDDTSTTSLQDALVKSFDPNQTKLQEIQEYLEQDEEKQAKRIGYLEKHYNKSTVRVIKDDALEFLAILRDSGLSAENASLLEEVIRKAITEVGTLINNG